MYTLYYSSANFVLNVEQDQPADFLLFKTETEKVFGKLQNVRAFQYNCYSYIFINFVQIVLDDITDMDCDESFDSREDITSPSPDMFQHFEGIAIQQYVLHALQKNSYV